MITEPEQDQHLAEGYATPTYGSVGPEAVHKAIGLQSLTQSKLGSVPGSLHKSDTDSQQIEQDSDEIIVVREDGQHPNMFSNVVATEGITPRDEPDLERYDNPL